MWQPQGFYNQYVLRTPVILSGDESVRGLYNYPAARIAVIHGKSFADKDLFLSTFSKRDIHFGAFVLQGVEIPLHRRIVVWISGFAYALDHMGRFAELYESMAESLLSSVVHINSESMDYQLNFHAVGEYSCRLCFVTGL